MFVPQHSRPFITCSTQVPLTMDLLDTPPLKAALVDWLKPGCVFYTWLVATQLASTLKKHPSSCFFKSLLVSKTHLDKFMPQLLKSMLYSHGIAYFTCWWVGKSWTHKPTEAPGHWSQQIHRLTGTTWVPGTQPKKYKKIHPDAPWHPSNMSGMIHWGLTNLVKQPSLQLNLLVTNPSRLLATMHNILQLSTTQNHHFLLLAWQNSKTCFSIVVSFIHLNSTTKPWPPRRDVVISKR